jgi:hypothetical protein
MMPISPTLYAAAGAAIVIAGLSGYAYVQTTRLGACKAEHELFVVQVKAAGDAQNAATAAANAANKAKKGKTDAENKRLRAANQSLVAKLREQRPGSSFVPGPDPASKRPDLACYDRPELERATGILVDRLRRLADEGTAATIDLDTLKGWAQNRVDTQ